MLLLGLLPLMLSRVFVMLYLLLFFSGAFVFRNSKLLFYLLLSTGSNIPGTLTWDCCCCICCCLQVQIFQELSPGIVVVVSDFVYNVSRNSHLGLLLLYLLLLTGVVAYDVVHRFQYFQELSPSGGVVVPPVVHMFHYFQGLLPGGGVVVSDVVYRFHHLQKILPSGGVAVSAVVHMFQYL